MNDETLIAMKEHAVREFPREACGLVAVVRGRERYFPCRNIATQIEHFAISPEDYAEVEEQGDVTAIVHSHPNAAATASEADRVACEKTKLPWYIVSVGKYGTELQAGAVSNIVPCGYEAPLVGRTFVHGVLDCYALVQDYYERELGIKLSDYEREDKWWEHGQDLYSLDRLRAEGFEVITDAPRKGDMVLMQIRSPVPNHAGVYLGDGTILHHVYNRMSSRDLYDGYFQECTRMIVRHREAQ